MTSSPKIAVLVSGGLDSAILVHQYLRASKTVYPIYVISGHIWEKIELQTLRKFLRAIRHKHLKPLVCLLLATRDLYDGHWSQNGKTVPGARTGDWKVYLPGKNVLLLAKGATYCALHKIPAIALGPLKTNVFPDASPRFFQSFGDAMSRGLGHKISVKAPFLKRTKREVMKLGRNLPLELTFSCLNPKQKKHCGRCNKCAERKKAFRNSGISDRTKYIR